MKYNFSSILQESFKRDSDILINEIDTVENILGLLSDLKYRAKTQAIEVANDNYEFKQANLLRKNLINFEDTEDEISSILIYKIKIDFLIA
jgi:hypothetical protein